MRRRRPKTTNGRKTFPLDCHSHTSRATGTDSDGADDVAIQPDESSKFISSATSGTKRTKSASLKKTKTVSFKFESESGDGAKDAESASALALSDAEFSDDEPDNSSSRLHGVLFDARDARNDGTAERNGGYYRGTSNRSVSEPARRFPRMAHARDDQVRSLKAIHTLERSLRAEEMLVRRKQTDHTRSSEGTYLSSLNATASSVDVALDPDMQLDAFDPQSETSEDDDLSRGSLLGVRTPKSLRPRRFQPSMSTFEESD